MVGKSKGELNMGNEAARLGWSKLLGIGLRRVGKFNLCDNVKLNSGKTNFLPPNHRSKSTHTVHDNPGKPSGK